MIQTVEAIVEEDGQVRLLQPVHGSGRHRAIVTILDENLETGGHETTLLSEAAPAKTRTPPEDDASNDTEKWAQRRKAVESVRAFREKMRLKYGVQPDSTPMIREARDHPRA